MKGDLDKDGKMSGYEQARQDAIEKNMREQKQTGGSIDCLLYTSPSPRDS